MIVNINHLRNLMLDVSLRNVCNSVDMITKRLSLFRRFKREVKKDVDQQSTRDKRSMFSLRERHILAPIGHGGLKTNRGHGPEQM